MATLREAVFYRDNYVCKICGRKATEGAIFTYAPYVLLERSSRQQPERTSNSMRKVPYACQSPKSGKLYGFGEKIKFADLSGAAFMNTVRWQIVNELYVAFGKPFCYNHLRRNDKEKRIALQLEKSHNNDAYAMGEFHPNLRCMFEHYERQGVTTVSLKSFMILATLTFSTGEIATGKELFNGRINRNHKRIRKICTNTVARGHTQGIVLCYAKGESQSG